VDLIDRMDATQRRHAVLGFPIAVGYKFFEDAGMHLVATLAYYALISCFPMALLMAALVAGIMAIWPDSRAYLANSLLANVPLVRSQIATTSGVYGGTLGVLVGALGSLYGGLGVANGFQHAMNQVWAVPRNGRPNPVMTRVRSLVILVLVLSSVVGSSVIAGVGPQPGDTSSLSPHWIWPVLIFTLNVALMVIAFRYATGGGITTRQVLPGALIAGLLWPTFQVTAMSSLRDADTSTAKGVATLILGLVALLHLGALVVVLCAELNVVIARRLWPRALLTPFTDHVDLTDADQASYAAQARSQRFKAYQDIQVSFGPRPSRAPRRSARGLPAVEADEPASQPQ
jgi:Predicted membrane protein